MTPRLIAFDLDDTFIHHITQLPERNIQAARAAIKAGHKVVIASARPLCQTRWVHEAVGMDTPICNLNGAWIRTPDGRYESRNYLPGILVKELMNQLLAFPEGELYQRYVEEDDFLYYDHMSSYEYWTDHVQRGGGICMKPGFDYPARSCARIMVWTQSDSAKDRVLALFQNRPDTEVQWTPANSETGSPHFLALYHARANKWHAIRQMAELWGIPDENIITFGDQWNDLMMLSKAGRGYAMKGSFAQKKDVTPYTTTLTAVEGGVGETIERLLNEWKK